MRRIWTILATSLVLVLTGSAAAEAEVAPSTADGFTAMYAAKNDRVFSGGDQTTSVRVSSSLVYWIHSDVVLSSGVDSDGSYPDTGTTMVGSRILRQAGGQMVNATPATGEAPAIPNPPTRTDANNERYWAQGGFYHNGHLYVLAQRVRNDGAGGFEFVGSEVAKFYVNWNGNLTFVRMLATPSTGKPQGAGPQFIQWAADGMVRGSYYAYIYGYTLAQGNPFVSHYSYLARVPVAYLGNAARWQYWKASASTWVSSVDQLSTDLVNQPDSILPSQVASARYINGKYVLADKPWNQMGSDVFLRVGSHPGGPWTSTKVFSAPAGSWDGVNYHTYSPQLHPEQPLTSGKLLVSINWNGATFADMLANADVYKPRFHEAPQP